MNILYIYHEYTQTECTYIPQVKDAEHRLLHKLFPPNSWMKLTDFNVLTSCPKDELHQWFLGLYGEHIIPAMVHRYTQVLQRPDLIWHDRKIVAHPIMSNEVVARVFWRLANRLQGVVANTLMMTISPEYAAHFLEVYVKKTENTKFTGDRVRFLMLTLPFVVRDLIAPEVFRYAGICNTYSMLYNDIHGICQVYDLNQKIRAAAKDRNSPLYNVPLVEDPSNEIAEVLIEALEWNMMSREWNVTVSDLQELHRKSISLLEMLKTHFPDRVGGAQGWNFEKAHSILHKVREIVMWGWSENTSCQGPEHAHIDIIKSVAHLTNNKDVFLCILRYHCRRGLLQQYEQLLEDMIGPGEARNIQMEKTRMEKALTGDRNFSISCELGVRYPSLRAMINREDLHLRMSVRLC